MFSILIYLSKSPFLKFEIKGYSDKYSSIVTPHFLLIIFFIFSEVKEESSLFKLFVIIFFDLNNGPKVFPRKYPSSDAYSIS